MKYKALRPARDAGMQRGWFSSALELTAKGTKYFEDENLD
jgi:hypothetical protein